MVWIPSGIQDEFRKSLPQGAYNPMLSEAMKQMAEGEEAIMSHAFRRPLSVSIWYHWQCSVSISAEVSFKGGVERKIVEGVMGAWKKAQRCL